MPVSARNTRGHNKTLSNGENKFLSWVRRDWGIALAAGVGGIAPPLAYLGIDLVYRGGTVPGSSYLLGLAIFFALGAGIALVLKESSVRRALFLGIGLPALVSGAISEATRTAEGYSPAAGPRAYLGLFVSPVMAQMPAQTANELYIPRNADLPSMTGWFYSDSGTPISSIYIPTFTDPTVVQVPTDAASFKFVHPNFSTEAVPLSKGDDANTYIELYTRAEPWSGFKRALGFQDAKPKALKTMSVPEAEWQGGLPPPVN